MTMPGITELFHTMTPRYPELRGKCALVTGSSQGIGLGIAVRLAVEHMRVMVAGLEADAVQAAVDELRGLGVEAQGTPGDLSDEVQVDHLIDTTEQACGGIDVLVNNAADLRRALLADMDRALLDHQLAVNVRAPLLLAQRAAALMPEGGSMINISSVGGLRVHDDAFPYDVTKGAIDTMTRGLAIDLAPRNIRANAVAPGGVLTRRAQRFLQTHPDPAYHTTAQRIPLGRRGTVAEIAGVVAFLASDDAAYITGQIIYVDGGITAQLNPPGQPI